MHVRLQLQWQRGFKARNAAGKTEKGKEGSLMKAFHTSMIALSPEVSESAMCPAEGLPLGSSDPTKLNSVRRIPSTCGWLSHSLFCREITYWQNCSRLGLCPSRPAGEAAQPRPGPARAGQLKELRLGSEMPAVKCAARHSPPLPRC